MSLNGRCDLTEVGQVVNDCMGYLGGRGKQFMMTLQGFAWSSTERYPTYGEERYWTFMTLMRPVAGLLYWVDYRADAAMTATVNRVMSEASGMSGVLLGGTLNDPAVSVNNGGRSLKYGCNRRHPHFSA